jgi:cytochrome c-type biogenesis protein CcmH
VKQGSPWLGFVYGLATAGIIGGLIYFASQGSTERTAGGSVTGGGPMAPAGPSSTDGGIPALEDAVRKEPTRIEPRIELTRAYLQQRDLMKVFEQTKAILEIEPGNAHALTYQALVRVAMGQADQAEKMLETAIRTNPRIEDAYIHLAIARIQMGNRKGAEEAIAAGQKEFPDDKEALASVFAQITGAVDEKQAQTANGTPDGTGAPPPTSSGGPSESVVVVVDLPKGQSAPPNALLFVIVREAGFASGPPVAVKRVPATGFPLTITLSDKDSMAGESLPPLVRIDARIDGDGDPLTKNPRDPVASEDNVKRGTGQVRLVLSPPAS